MPPPPVIANLQQFEADSALEPAFSLDSLSAAEREQAKRLANAMSAVMVKALMHRLRPDEFRIAGGDNVESRTAAAINAIDPQRFARMRPKIEAFYNNQARLSEQLGGLAHIDLKKPGLDSQILQVIPGVFAAAQHPQQHPQQPPQQPPQPTFKRLTLVLRKLHCVDETNPEGGDDDMILGGLLVDAAGKTSAVNAFVAGHFDDGELQNFGAMPLGQFSLDSTSGYPKLFYCIFYLVESDSDDEEAAHAVTHALSIVADIAKTFSGTVGVIAAAVVDIIDGLLGFFIDDDYFPPYSVQLKLHSTNDFGPSGTAPNQHTDNISAHGGTYRIGYRWELSA